MNYFFNIPGAPCLSFDVLPDKLGDSRESFPLTCYIVAGTQAERGQPNYINVMKLHNITKTQKDQNDESDDDSEGEEEEELPELNLVTLNHTGSVNRIRVRNHFLESYNLTQLSKALEFYNYFHQ